MKVLFDELKEVYEIDGKGVKPIQATVTRWVDHKLKAMLRLVSAFRVYTQHQQNVIADTSKKCDHATVKGTCSRICTGAIVFVDRYFRVSKKLELENAEKQFKYN